MLAERSPRTRYKDAAAMRELLRAACKAAGSQKAWARKNGCSTAYVGDVLNGRREAGEKIAEALGFVVVRLYQYQWATRSSTRKESP